MAKIPAPPFQSLSPNELLGPLNDIETLNAPKSLFAAGDFRLAQGTVRVAMVGSREASSDGLRRAAKLARELVERNVVVVSGLAKGVDGTAQRAALEAGGRTIAVIGTPLDQAYPKEHAELQQLLAREHLVVSEFPIGYPVRPSNFPRRNRTMALMCHASVIVEAGDSSGTLSQGWEALRLGRPLFMMQSVLENRSLTWPQEMLGYGARLLSSTEDLLDVLPADGRQLSAAAF